MIDKIIYWLFQTRKDCKHCCLWCEYYDLPCAGISVEQITQAMETFTEAVFAAAGNICDALAQMFGRQAQAFNAVAEQYKDDKAGAVHGK